MKIILEGADGTGKTTLAKKLARTYDLSYVNVNRNDPNDFNFYYETMKKTKVVYDRHFIGEMIYPSVFKRKGNLEKEDFEWLLEYARDKDVKILVLHNDPKLDMVHRLDDDEYDEVITQIMKINEEFIKIAKEYEIPLIDIMKTHFDDICELIEND